MYNIFAPAPRLRPFVEMYMVYRGLVPGGRALLGPVPVDGQADLIFNFADPYERTTGEQQTGERAPGVDETDAVDIVRGSTFDGPRTRPMRLWQVGYHFAVALRFQPGGLSAFTETPAREYRGTVVEVSDFLGSTAIDVEDQLFHAARRSFSAVPGLLDAFLLDRITIPPDAGRLHSILRQVHASNGTASIRTLADDVHLSARSLRRIFRKRMGISPKVYVRTVRLRHALNLVWGTEESLARIALDAGYADQSHFTREAIELAGMSPGVARGLF